MNIEEINAVLAPLFPRGGDSVEGYISAVDLHESLVQLMALVERDIQRAVAAASAYGQYVYFCDTEIEWQALQSEAAGATIPVGCLAVVKESADPGSSVDTLWAWDGTSWLNLLAMESTGGG